MKPKIIMHTQISLDGRIKGFDNPEVYYQVAGGIHSDAVLFGSYTVFTAFEKYPAVRRAHGAQRGHGQPGHAHRQRRGQQLRAGLQRRLWSGLADQQPCHFYGRSHEPDHVGLRLPEHRGRPAEAGAGGVVESNHPFGRSRSGDIAPGAWVCLRVFRLF